MHGGPFANIAHGCNSVRATHLALKLADYCITEAGFGSDLGAEKFFDIKCRSANLSPAAVVLVATVRALKYNGKMKIDQLKNENLKALNDGIKNLGAHIDNMKKFGIPVIVAINKFDSDTSSEINLVEDYCREKGVDFALSEAFSQGGNGALELAKILCKTLDEKKANFKPLYPLNISIKEKIETLAKEIYHAGTVTFTDKAKKAMYEISLLGRDNLPVCVAKTQYSFSDNKDLLGAPTGFNLTVRDVKISNGAGFIVVFTGDIMTMPGLPKVPAANNIDIDENSVISGLF